MPSIPGWLGPSAAHLAPALAPERTVNLYLEVVQGGAPGAALHSMPGLRPLALVPQTPIRGLYTASNGRVFVIANSAVYELLPNWEVTSRGTIPTGTSLASMTDNGIDFFFSVSGLAFRMPFGSNFVTAVTPEEPATFGQVTYLDGYILTNKPGTQQFYWSDLVDAGTWDALNFASASGKPDLVVGLIADHRELWVAGSETMEVFYSSGNVNDPFVRLQGAFIEQGCVAPRSLAAVNNAVFWLGGTTKGHGPVWTVSQGYQPQRVSTDALEQTLGTYPNISDAVAWTGRIGGHAFYGLDFPSGAATWCFDITQGAWTELAGLTPQGALGAYPGLTHTLAFGEHIFGDRGTGQLYAWDMAYHQYGTQPRLCMRTAPHLRRENKPISYGLFELLVQMGEYAEPEAALTWPALARLTWSDDGGKSWVYEKVQPIGWLGEYGLGARWRALGQARRQRSFRVMCDAPVAQTWIDASVEVS